jgi:hypothetical protein
VKKIRLKFGTIKDQFLGSKESKNSDLKLHILENKKLLTMTQKRLFIIANSNPRILALHLA